MDEDLHGILHCHTDASDGTKALETMAKATCRRGFQYFGVADHSKSAHYTGGLSLEQIEKQHREADRLNRSFGKEFRILKGINSSRERTRSRAVTPRKGVNQFQNASQRSKPHLRGGW